MTNLNRETTTVSEKSEGRSVSQRSNKSDKAKAFQRAKSLCSPSELGNEPEKKKEVRSKKPPVPKFPRKPKPDTTISPVTAMDTEAKPFESEIIGETNDTDKPITKPKKTKSKLEKKNSKAILIATEIPQELPEETKLPEESENHLEIVEKIPEERVIKSAASIKHNKDEEKEKEIEKEDVVREPTPKPKTPIAERSPSEMLGEAEEKMESKEIHKVDSIEEISALPQGTAEPEHPPIIDRLNLSDSGNSSSRPTTRQYLHGKIPDETGKEAEKSTIELLDETDLNIIEDDGESIFTSSKTRLSRSGSLSDNNSASRPPPLSSFVKQLEERARKPT